MARIVRGAPRLRSLQTTQFGLNDSAYREIGRLVYLEKLALFNEGTNDDQAACLSSLSRLQFLFINGVVTDRTLERLGNHPSLVYLLIYGSVTDSGLESLSRLKQLKTLAVNDQQFEVSSAGLRHLLAIKSLKSLHFQANNAFIDSRTSPDGTVATSIELAIKRLQERRASRDAQSKKR
jgi:hypothetical protein